MSQQARLAHCRFCPDRAAVAPTGRLEIHGNPQCRGSGRYPATFDLDPTEHYWPAHHYGRQVVTIPGPDTWNPKENAA